MFNSVLNFVFILLFLHRAKGEACDKILGSEDSFVCICKDASCSTIGRVDPPGIGNYTLVSSSRDELRFSITDGSLNTGSSLVIDTTISIDTSKTRQTIIGFGGAFTDASGLNIAKLNPILQETLIKHYFGPEGIEYSLGRVPIAGTDFSTRPYSYDDVDGDTELTNFALAPEDYKYKLPYIKMALNVSERGVRFFASPWAPPYWMKTNQMVNGSGSLLPEMQQPWANYFIKFFEAYEQESITFWGLTSQNEPTQGLVTNHPWNACGYTAESMLQFIRDYLGPTLTASSYSGLQLMMPDDNREIFPVYPNTILEDAVAASYIQGIAIHWYADKIIPVAVVNDVHLQHPDKFILYTEACHEPVLFQSGDAVKLGSWEYAEEYAYSVIENSNHWSSGWVDWNLVLDMDGGPNWAENQVDAPVIVSVDGLEFYKQPMFYALGHFSKFVPAGSVSVDTSVNESDAKPRQGTVFSSSYVTPTNEVVVVILSQNDDPENINITDSNGNSVVITIPARSFHTLIYNN